MIAHGQGRCSCNISTVITQVVLASGTACTRCLLLCSCVSISVVVTFAPSASLFPPTGAAAGTAAGRQHAAAAHGPAPGAQHAPAQGPQMDPDPEVWRGPTHQGKGGWLAAAAGGRTHHWEGVGRRGLCTSRERGLAGCSGRGPYTSSRGSSRGGLVLSRPEADEAVEMASVLAMHDWVGDQSIHRVVVLQGCLFFE